MSSYYLMGIDVGVSFIKTGIYDTSGKLVSMSVIEKSRRISRAGRLFTKKQKDV